jgi:hypothetical protein
MTMTRRNIVAKRLAEVLQERDMSCKIKTSKHRRLTSKTKLKQCKNGNY